MSKTLLDNTKTVCNNAQGLCDNISDAATKAMNSDGSDFKNSFLMPEQLLLIMVVKMLPGK